jgi:hypothetical protein
VEIGVEPFATAFTFASIKDLGDKTSIVLASKPDFFALELPAFLLLF